MASNVLFPKLSPSRHNLNALDVTHNVYCTLIPEIHSSMGIHDLENLVLVPVSSLNFENVPLVITPNPFIYSSYMNPFMLSAWRVGYTSQHPCSVVHQWLDTYVLHTDVL